MADVNQAEQVIELGGSAGRLYLGGSGVEVAEAFAPAFPRTGAAESRLHAALEFAAAALALLAIASLQGTRAASVLCPSAREAGKHSWRVPPLFRAVTTLHEAAASVDSVVGRPGG